MNDSEFIEQKLAEALDANDNGFYTECESLCKEVLGKVDVVLSETSLPMETSKQFKTYKSSTLRLLGANSRSMSMVPEAFRLLKEALFLAREINNEHLTAQIQINLGMCYHSMADIENAVENLKESLAIAERLNDLKLIEMVCSNLGTVYRGNSSYVRAIEYFKRASEISVLRGDKEGIARSKGNIGIIYGSLTKYDHALEYMNASLALAEETENRVLTVNLLSNIGLIHHHLGNIPDAFEMMNRSLALAEEMQNKQRIARQFSNLSSLYQTMSQFELSLDTAKKALQILEEINDRNLIATTYGNLGKLYSTVGFSDENDALAEEYYLKAIAIFTEINERQKLFETNLMLSQLYEKQERWKEFAYRFKLYHELENEIRSEEVQQAAQGYELELKEREFEATRRLLHNVLPSQIAERMVSGEKTIADSYDNVSVFFSDIVGFTKLSLQISAEQLVRLLNGIFSQFDQIARKHGLEKIKTIGDSYMAVCGAPIPMENHAERAALFALEVAEMMNDYRTDSGEKIEVRIGLHTGSVVAGIIGENKFAYDLWGDAVNTASRMENYGEAGKIHTSEDFVMAVESRGNSFPSRYSIHFVPRGEMDIKGKGIMKTYFLEKQNDVR